jgi:hypothetical protein
MGNQTLEGAAMRRWRLTIDEPIREPRFYVPCSLLLIALAINPALFAGPDDDAAKDNNDDNRSTVIVVLGAAGTAEYGREFAGWAKHWKNAADKGKAKHIVIGSNESNTKVSDRDRLQQTLEAASGNTDQDLWLVLIGHGTFDGRAARFNLRGPDVSASELAEWLKPLRRPTAVINCASASGPFLNKLSADNRVVITAAKSGFEQNYARFGKYLSAAIADPQADLDKDGQTSLLEAWLAASRKVEEFYSTEGRLKTEHSLLDDNGDRLAVRADFFRGIRPIKKPAGKSAVDGYRAHQFHLVRSPETDKLPPELRRHLNELEREVIGLRDKKPNIPPADYYRQLEALLVELAEAYEQVGSVSASEIIPASAKGGN